MSVPDTKTLILLNGIMNDEAVSSFVKALDQDDIESYAHTYKLLLQVNMQDRWLDYLTNVLIKDDNLFARRAFSGTLNPATEFAYLHDLKLLRSLAQCTEHLPPKIAAEIKSGFPKILNGNSDNVLGTMPPETALQTLSAYYKQNGYGIFLENKAFTYENGSLCPVSNTSNITLRDLKDYEEEKRAIKNNIVSFLENLPFSNMLLYGDKGTGKSSTIHAMLNEFAEQGLRAVEVPKEKVADINDIKNLLSTLPFRFLIFIDDLALEEHDEKVTSLKASLEGSMNEKSRNVMIVATSNRRHILKENFSDRENSVHARDTMEEQLSLSDRFGLTVCFSSTGKQEYLSIVRQLAEDAKLTLSEQQLFSYAERWAIVKGGRSPRRAKQLVDYISACVAKNIEIDF